MRYRQIFQFVGAAASAAVVLACGAAAAAKTLPTDAHAPGFSGHRYAAQARVSLADARGIALKARSGTITDEELERERGGSGLRYSFDVKDAAAVVWEVGVDARTGAVLENDREGAHPD